MSASRKLQRRLARAPIEEPPEIVEERRKLMEKLKFHADSVGEKDPMRFLKWARQVRRGYDPKHDGPSDMMTMVDDFDALDAVAEEIRAGLPDGETEQ